MASFGTGEDIAKQRVLTLELIDVIGKQAGDTVCRALALRKAKARGAGSALVHAAYWYLPGSFLGLKATPPSHCRLLAG